MMSETQNTGIDVRDRSLIVELLRDFHDPEDLVWMSSWEILIKDLIHRGYSRLRLYQLLISIETQKDRLTEKQSDFLFDFETSVTGHCHYDCILRFPNEPSEKEAFLSYLHEGRWKDKT